MKKKTRQVKARLLYVDEHPKSGEYLGTLSDYQDGITPHPVFVLPATPEAWDAMVEQGAKAAYLDQLPRKKPGNGLRWKTWEELQDEGIFGEPSKKWYRELSRAFLTALALVRPTK